MRHQLLPWGGLWQQASQRHVLPAFAALLPFVVSFSCTGELVLSFPFLISFLAVPLAGWLLGVALPGFLLPYAPPGTTITRHCSFSPARLSGT